MRKSLLLAATAASLALAGCNNAAEEADDTAADTTTVEDTVVEEVLAADGGAPAGTYEVTDSEGNTNTYVANPDGTFTITNAAGEQVATGTWRQEADGRWCDAVEGEEEECYIETIDENGVWTSVNEADPTDTGTVVRIN